MILLPAIDIKDGKCVRLTKGDFSTVETVADDWLLTAGSFAEAGAEWVHMVDLDGALEGKTKNEPIFIRVARETGLSVQVGGGIRSMQSISNYLENGIRRVILGSAAIEDKKLVKSAVKEYKDRIAVGIDAKNRIVQGSGWIKSSGMDFIEFAKTIADLGVATLIFTDISKDGTLGGPNLSQLEELSGAVPLNIIASGGIHGMEDIIALSEMGLYGAICGKSLYKGTLSLKEAIIYEKNKK